MLIDTHCHLAAAEFAADRESMLARARAAGVAALVVPAVERANFAAVSDLAHNCNDVFATYGIHPLAVERACEDDLEWLRRTLTTERRAVAVGEIGLDRFVEGRDEVRQGFYFVEQLKIARDLGLPVILHVRRAIDPVLRELRRIKVSGGIAHAFNGSRQQADEFIKLGFVLGFGGAMTYPSARRIRQLAAALPLNSIVLETDAPDMAPEWIRGGRNEPKELMRIAETLAELRKLPVAECIKATGENTRRVLPRLIIPPHAG